MFKRNEHQIRLWFQELIWFLWLQYLLELEKYYKITLKKVDLLLNWCLMKLNWKINLKSINCPKSKFKIIVFIVFDLILKCVSSTKMRYTGFVIAIYIFSVSTEIILTEFGKNKEFLPKSIQQLKIKILLFCISKSKKCIKIKREIWKIALFYSKVMAIISCGLYRTKL